MEDESHLWVPRRVRDKDIVERFLPPNPQTHSEIAKYYKLTSARVCQIINDAGYTGKDGGKTVIMKERRAKEKKRKK